MLELDAKKVWQMPNNELISIIKNGDFPNSIKKIRFYAPSFVYYKTKYFCSSPKAFPSISITGSSCSLKCKHCFGKVLQTMTPVQTPEDLFNLCKKIKKKGAVGCLISGGCLPDGSVPIDEFIDVIAEIKRTLDFTIITHTGIIDFSTAKRLQEAKVDAALIDIIGSNETIQEIYNLNVNVEDYDQSLKALHESGIPFVPHVLVGLHQGRLEGEFEALKLIEKYSPSAVIVIAFMPIRNTPMENVNPPKPEDIIRTLASARLLMPDIPLVLGCMRPKAEHRVETDILAVRVGANAIAFPSEEAIKLAKSMSLEISYSSLCCSQIFTDIVKV